MLACRGLCFLFLFAALKVFGEKVEGAFPGELGGGRVVARRGIVMEAVIGPLVD